MLIPSIDLQGGRIVQLVQGERLAVETSDFDGWIRKFTGYPKVQLIDLDAAKNAGANEALIATICSRLPCRVGGGIRTPARARALVDLGATGVILASSLFKQGVVDIRIRGVGMRSRRHRAIHRRRRQPRRTCRRRRLAHDARADANGRGANPRAVRRRVPVYARRPRGPHAGNRHGAPSRPSATPRQGASRRQAVSRRWMR